MVKVKDNSGVEEPSGAQELVEKKICEDFFFSFALIIKEREDYIVLKCRKSVKIFPEAQKATKLNTTSIREDKSSVVLRKGCNNENRIFSLHFLWYNTSGYPQKLIF